MNGLLAFAFMTLGIRLYPGQREVLGAWIASGKRKAVLALGRRSGKDLMAAVVAIHHALVEDYSGDLRPGEQRFIVVVATRVEQAREFCRVVRELIANAVDPAIRALVDEAASTADEVVFRTGVTLRAMPCSSRSTRGLPISLLILNEAAHMQSSEDGHAAGRRVYQALAPSVAQFGPRGYILLLSSTYWPFGLFYDLYVAGLSGADRECYVSRRPTWEMNARISRESLDAEFAADPETARVEYGAEFADGAGSYFDPVAVQSCVVSGRRVLPRLPGVRYFGGIDPAFAAGGDSFTMAIAHSAREQDAPIIVDRIDAWRGKYVPLNSDAAFDEVAKISREYGLTRVVSDQYSGQTVADGLARRGIHVDTTTLTNMLKHDVLQSLLRSVNLGRIQLLDDPALINEMKRLEKHATRSGLVRIEAGPGAHDDRVLALAMVTHLIGKSSRQGAYGEWARRRAVRLGIAEPLPEDREWIAAEVAAASRPAGAGGRARPEIVFEGGPW